MDDDDGYFGEGVAARYDESYADMFDSSVVDAVVEVLAGLAPAGRALELGMGTERIAAGPAATPFAADLPRPPSLLSAAIVPSVAPYATEANHQILSNVEAATSSNTRA